MNMEQWFGDAPKYVIKTPATSANLGPGFDCFGMAVNLHNELWIKRLPAGEVSTITVEGYGGDDAANLNNLIYQAYLKAYNRLGETVPAVAMHCINRVPFARGLGSSSAAAVSGLIAAQVLSGNRLTKDELMEMAAGIDGHPDNVIPALLGGVVIAYMDDDGKVFAQKIDPAEGLHAYALIPDYPLATSKARAAMPDGYSREDVVHNLSHLGYLVACFAKGDIDGMKGAFSDRVHEPYRLPLMPGIPEAREAALEIGAIGALVSGAGSTMLILSDQQMDFSPVLEAFESKGYTGKLIEVSPIKTGVQCFNEETELKLWL